LNSKDLLSALECTKVIDKYVDAWIDWALHMKQHHGDTRPTIEVMQTIAREVASVDHRMNEIVAANLLQRGIGIDHE